MTFPLPLPVGFDVTAIHGALLMAVHAHPALLDTASEPGPTCGADRLGRWLERVGTAGGLIDGEGVPRNRSVPVRSAPGLDATVKSTVPLPLPVART